MANHGIFNMEDATKILSGFGIDPHSLSNDKLQKIARLGMRIKSPEDVTPDMMNQISDVLGLRFEPNKPKPVPKKRETAKVGRNDKCFCGSDKKYKKCCGRN